MRAVSLLTWSVNDASIEVFDITDPDGPLTVQRKTCPVIPPRLWIARGGDRVLAAATVESARAYTAVIHCDFRVDEGLGTDVAQGLLVAAFKYCREQGMLKIIVEGRWEGLIQAAANAVGMTYWRTKMRGGHEAAELFVSLYREGVAYVSDATGPWAPPLVGDIHRLRQKLAEAQRQAQEAAQQGQERG